MPLKVEGRFNTSTLLSLYTEKFPISIVVSDGSIVVIDSVGAFERWLLLNGFWSDLGSWDDSAFWIDFGVWLLSTKVWSDSGTWLDNEEWSEAA